MESGKKIFVSYSHKDDDFTRHLVNDLQAANINLWVDYQQRKLGRVLLDQLKTATESCEGILLIVSPDSMKSKYVKDEFDHFYQKGKEIISVICRPTGEEYFFFGISSRLYLDFSRETEQPAIKYRENLNILIKTLIEEGFINPKPSRRSSTLEQYDTQVSVFEKSNILSTLPATFDDTLDTKEKFSTGFSRGNIAEIYGSLLLSSYFDESTLAIEAIKEIGIKQIEVWLAAVDHPDSVKPRIIPIMIGLLFDDDNRIAIQAMRTLESWGLLNKIPGLLYSVGSAATYKVVKTQNEQFLNEAIVVISKYAAKENLAELYLLQDLIVELLPRNEAVKRVKDIIDFINSQMGDSQEIS